MDPTLFPLSGHFRSMSGHQHIIRLCYIFDKMEDTTQGHIHHKRRKNAQHTFKINVFGFEMVLTVTQIYVIFRKLGSKKPQSNVLS